MEKKELSAVRKKTENPLVSGLEQGDVGGCNPPTFLVRMRSPVQIWSAAPENSLFLRKQAVFLQLF